MPNLDLTWKRDLSNFRRVALGTWQTTYDPSVYGTLDIRMEKALQYIEEFREKTGKRLTITHLVVKAAAMALKEMPDANAILRFNRIYLRKNISIFFQVAMTDEGPERLDLSGVTLHNVDQKSLLEICEEAQARVEQVRARQDPELEKSRKSFQYLPGLLLNPTLKLLSFLLYTLNLDLRALGLPKDAFGSVMITNIGTLGLDTAYVPLVPYSRVPILLALGAVKDVPVVEDGAIKAGKVMKINATFDHRLIDGAHAAVMARSLRNFLEDPFSHYDPLGA